MSAADGEWFDVAPADDIPRGEVRTYEADNTEVAIFNLDGEFFFFFFI